MYSKRLFKKKLVYYRKDEKKASRDYASLSRFAKSPRDKKIIRSMARDESRHNQNLARMSNRL